MVLAGGVESGCEGRRVCCFVRVLRDVRVVMVLREVRGWDGGDGWEGGSSRNLSICNLSGNTVNRMVSGVVMVSGEDDSWYLACFNLVSNVKMPPFIQYWLWVRHLVLPGNNVIMVWEAYHLVVPKPGISRVWLYLLSSKLIRQPPYLITCYGNNV